MFTVDNYKIFIIIGHMRHEMCRSKRQKKQRFDVAAKKNTIKQKVNINFCVKLRKMQGECTKVFKWFGKFRDLAKIEKTSIRKQLRQDFVEKIYNKYILLKMNTNDYDYEN